MNQDLNRKFLPYGNKKEIKLEMQFQYTLCFEYSIDAA